MNRDVIALIGLQAGAGMSKEARFGSVMEHLTGFGRRGEEWLPRLRNPWAIPRTAAYGAGALAAGQGLWNSRQSTVGRSLLNPATYIAPNKAQDVFQNRVGSKNDPGDWYRLRNEANSRIAAAMGEGNVDEATALKKQLDEQSYHGGSSGTWNPGNRDFWRMNNWRLGGVNPWADDTMKGNADVARSLQARDQSQYNLLKAHLDQQRNNMLPQQVNDFETQLEQIQNRMNATNALPGSTPPPNRAAPAGGYWNLAERPTGGNWMNNPYDYDFRRDPSLAQPWDREIAGPGIIRG